MIKMSADEIRESFLAFFETKEHLRLPSFSLVPVNDPTLLIIGAGMAPLKPYFKGEAKPPSPRITTCQKCVRVGDIEQVGRTARHHTFFEMLGNFSFGDYFKKEAILWAWEYFTKVLKLPEEKLYVTIHTEDDEAEKIWREEVGVPPEKIYRLEDNFWGPIGKTGPCGPCSEILVDQGEEFGCGKPTCQPGCDCDRYLELWNLVFTGLNKTEEGKYEKLPKPCIDTGLGFERLVAYIHGVGSAYETELFKGIIDKIKEITGKSLGEDKNTDVSIRVLADHIRSIVFMASDGITPSNEGRGYVMRRLLRRCVRVSRDLGFKDVSLSLLIDPVIEKFGNIYPELKEKRDYTHSIVKVEEENFKRTLKQGEALLYNILKRLENLGEKQVSGRDVFYLYDTYGFPWELTREIAEEKGFSIDFEGFEKEMARQRERARRETKKRLESLGDEIDLSMYSSEFTGYESTEENTTILALFKGGKKVNEVQKGEKAEAIFERTPFYGESGGQVGDIGVFKGDRFTGKVLNTLKAPSGVHIHKILVEEGNVQVGDKVFLKIDEDRRNAIRRHHTATHMLQSALRRILGSHVAQMGSLVDENRLRFDFSHHQAMKVEEIEEVERIVNREILKNKKVITDVVSLEEALQRGALAFFGEKYGKKVRVVQIPDFSIELCGGTHVSRTGDIGLFKIISESAIGMGIRRIEAVCGMVSLALFQKRERLLQDVASLLNTEPTKTPNAISKLRETVKSLEKQVKKLKEEISNYRVESLLKKVKEIDGVEVFVEALDNLDMEDIRRLSENLIKRIKGIVVLGSSKANKAFLISRLTSGLEKKGLSCVSIIKEIAPIVGGGGGGKSNFAQAGGKNVKKLSDALKRAEEIIKKQIEDMRVAK